MHVVLISQHGRTPARIDQLLVDVVGVGAFGRHSFANGNGFEVPIARSSVDCTGVFPPASSQILHAGKGEESASVVICKNTMSADDKDKRRILNLLETLLEAAREQRRAPRLRSELQDTARAVSELYDQVPRDTVEHLKTFIKDWMPKNPKGEIDMTLRNSDLWLCILHVIKTTFISHVDPRNMTISESHHFTRDQQALIGALRRQEITGPCSLEVLMRNTGATGHPQLVLLFGEWHLGAVGNFGSFLQEILSHFPIEMFIEVPFSCSKVDAFHKGTLFYDDEHRLHVIFKLIQAVRARDKARGFPDRFHFMDVRDFDEENTNADAVMCSEEFRPDVIAHLIIQCTRQIKREISKIPNAHDRGILERAMSSINSEFVKVLQVGASVGFNKIPENSFFILMSSWVDIYTVSRLIRKISRYPIAIVYAGDSHIKGTSARNNIWCYPSLEPPPHLQNLQILPLMHSLGFKTLASEDNCRTK